MAHKCQVQDGSDEKRKPKLECVTLQANPVSVMGIQNLLDAKEFSDFDKLLRVTGWVVRFVDVCRGSRRSRGDTLTADELLRAERMWAKSVQVGIQKGDNFEKISKSLGFFKDEHGVLRCGGRVKNASIPFEAKHPIIIPSKHWVTKLLIERAHREVFHNGVKETLTQLRSRFWITRGRQEVKSVIGSCNICKKLEGLSYGTPPFAQLPSFRVSRGRAFEAIGVDYFGPAYVKDSKNGEMEKVYVLLITCATSRMVHLEMANDLGVESLIRCLKRFFARRGRPSLIISDNAKTFKSKVLRKYIAGFGIKWEYNLAKAPWWGGMFERLIKSTKRCLNKALQNARLTYDMLHTLLVEI